MIDDMILRDVCLTQQQDSQLRQLAHETDVPKKDLIRAALSSWVEAVLTPGVPVKVLKAAIASPEAGVELLAILGVYRTLHRRLPQQPRRTKTLTV